MYAFKWGPLYVCMYVCMYTLFICILLYLLIQKANEARVDATLKLAAYKDLRHLTHNQVSECVSSITEYPLYTYVHTYIYVFSHGQAMYVHIMYVFRV